MSEITIVGLDLAKHMVSLCGENGAGRVVVQRMLRREAVVANVWFHNVEYIVEEKIGIIMPVTKFKARDSMATRFLGSIALTAVVALALGVAKAERLPTDVELKAAYC